MSFYVLNSIKSNANIDCETTGFGCVGIINGVATVCQYVLDMPPNTYVKFNDSAGLHVQTHLNADPHGTHQPDNCQVLIDTTTGSITFSDWAGPGEDTTITEMEVVEACEIAPPADSEAPIGV